MSIIRSRITATLLCTGVIGLGAMFVALPSRCPTGEERVALCEPRWLYHGRCPGRKRAPKAGVWVIAETKDLQTQMIKIVVTNDQGRFMLPELPGANYKVWVRGYGEACRFHSRRIETHHHPTDAESRKCEDSSGSGQGLSRRLLAIAVGAAPEESVPRNRKRG